MQPTVLIAITIAICVGLFVVNDFYPLYIFRFKLVNKRDRNDTLIVRVVARGFTKQGAESKALSAIEQVINGWNSVNPTVMYTQVTEEIMYLPRIMAYTLGVTGAISEKEALKR